MQNLSSSKDIIWTNYILNVCCDLDPEHNYPIFSLDTLAYEVTMIYHTSKFGCKRIIGSQDIVQNIHIYLDICKSFIFRYASPHCYHDLQDSNPIFLHDKLPNNDAPQYQVVGVFLKAEWLKKISSGQTTEILNLCCDPDLDQGSH